MTECRDGWTPFWTTFAQVWIWLGAIGIACIAIAFAVRWVIANIDG